MASASGLAVEEKKDQEIEPYIRDAMNIRNPGEALKLRAFLERYFADLSRINPTKPDEEKYKENTAKYNDDMAKYRVDLEKYRVGAKKAMSAYLQYLKTIVGATRLDKDPKFAPQLKLQSSDIEQCLEWGQLDVAKKSLENMSQLIQGQKPEEKDEVITFFIEPHQWKHYSGGESGAAQFSLEWEDVHRLLLCAMSSWIAAKTEKITGKTFYLMVTVTDAKSIGDGGTAEPGQTNLIKIEASWKKDRVLEIHGYPVGSLNFAKNKDKPQQGITTAQYKQYKLEAPNNDRRLK